jgi:diguanylate cyclase (GGDEF)-like protein
MTGRRAHRAFPDARVWTLCAALVAVAACLIVGLETVAPGPGRLHLPWWLLAVAFAATELCVVHIHVRRSSHSLTLGEIPLVLGLLFASPVELIAAWIVGAGCMLLIQRELPILRIVFNIALFGVTAGVAGIVFHAFSGAAERPGPAEWVAATAAAAASAFTAAALVAAAMSLSGEAPGQERLRSMLATGIAIAAVNAALGLAVATVLVADARGAILLLAPAAALLFAYRAYTAERNRSTSLDFLYAASRALTSSSDATAGLAGMLAMARETFRAELAQVWTFASPEAPGGRVGVDADGNVGIGAALDPAVADALRAMLDGRPAQRVSAAELDGTVGAALRDAGVRSVMLAPLAGERGSIGAMLMADRLGVGGDFAGEELRLFETLAHHTGAALGQYRLGRKVSELNEIQAGLERQAFHDPLTGLANRLLFMDRMTNALNRRVGNAAVLYIDLDDFKRINDTLGHEAGDDLLKAVAARLQDSLRPADTAARLGGDEFAVLLLDIEEENTRVVSDRILRALGAPCELPGTTQAISASIGLALADSGTLTAAELLSSADAAMYVCKHGGKRGMAVQDRRATAAMH